MDHPGEDLDDNGVLEPYHHPTLDGLQLCTCQLLEMTDENNNVVTTPDHDGFSESLSITVRNYLLNTALNTRSCRKTETDSDSSSASTLSLSTDDLTQLYYDLQDHTVTLDENGHEVACVNTLSYTSTSPPTSTSTSNEFTSTTSSPSEEAELSTVHNQRHLLNVTTSDKTKPFKKLVRSEWEGIILYIQL